jgi:hypothetical protein
LDSWDEVGLQQEDLGASDFRAQKAIGATLNALESTIRSENE